MELVPGVTREASKAAVRVADTGTLAHEIERDINLGRLGPGAWLKQIDLERAHGVSRLVVRQALERLAERGHVELIRNRGYRVVAFDLTRFNNITRIRAVLEVEAAENVAGQLDRPAITRMRSLAEDFATALVTGTPMEQEAANRAFHGEMLRGCANRDLVDLIFDLRDRIPVSVQRERYSAAMLRRSAEEHFEMVDLLQSTDRRALAALVRRHALGSLFETDG